MARDDPEGWGINLLGHDLAKLRDGAWIGLGQAADVALLKRLYRDWLETDNPIFRHAAYRAIDNILIRLEGYGKPEEIQQLRDFQTQVKQDIAENEKIIQHLKPKPYDQRDSVLTRVDWTLMKWECFRRKNNGKQKPQAKRNKFTWL